MPQESIPSIRFVFVENHAFAILRYAALLFTFAEYTAMRRANLPFASFVGATERIK